MTCGLLGHRLFRQLIFVFLFSILFTMQLSAQNGGLKDELSHSLSGTTVISTILVGGRAAPRGYQADYPVDTLVYPGNREVAYRMDLGSTSTTTTAEDMRRYFERGTLFQVIGLDLQDGWLELKLKSAGGDSARLRLMLGDGWQSKFDSSSIQARLACVLIPRSKATDQCKENHSGPGRLWRNLHPDASGNAIETRVRMQAPGTAAKYSSSSAARVRQGQSHST